MSTEPINWKYMTLLYWDIIYQPLYYVPNEAFQIEGDLIFFNEHNSKFALLPPYLKMKKKIFFFFKVVEKHWSTFEPSCPFLGIFQCMGALTSLNNKHKNKVLKKFYPNMLSFWTKTISYFGKGSLEIILLDPSSRINW